MTFKTQNLVQQIWDISYKKNKKKIMGVGGVFGKTKMRFGFMSFEVGSHKSKCPIVSTCSSV